MDKILIALPAFNEGKNISQIICRIKKEGFKDILVIDDCSLDNTLKEAKTAGAKVLRHVINRGAGAATLTGLEFAKLNNYDFIIFLDADGQHNPKDIKKLLKYSFKFDVIIGSRMIKNFKEMPLSRKIANFIGSLITWFFFRLFIRDSQSGFKIFNKNAINKINIIFDRYEFCSEIIGEIYINKLTYKEVPIDVIYFNHLKLKGQSIRNGFHMVIKFIFKK